VSTPLAEPVAEAEAPLVLATLVLATLILATLVLGAALAGLEEAWRAAMCLC